MKTIAAACLLDWIAGDPEWQSDERRRREGIPVSKGIWQQLTLLAESLNVPVAVG